MPTKQFVCGNTDSPIAGQTVFESSFLKECLVDFIVVNNAIETQLNPLPDFTHNYIEGKITRNNGWQIGDKLVVNYISCKNCI